MPILNKTKNTAAIYNRGREVVKVYDHGTLAWQKSIPDYLCFTALEAGQFTLTIPAAVTPTYLSYVEWSKDGRTWTHTDNTSEAVTIDVQVAQGEKVYWRGSGAAMAAPYVQGNASNFTSTARFDASGHIMSLLKGNDFANYTHLQGNTIDGILSRTFTYLFYHCDTIVNACDLVLPTFTSYHVNIYYSLFDTCTSLLTMPPLPSTELAGGCYTRLCFGCSSLLNAVPLPATTLANGCYNSMYYGCTSLTKGSDLPATNLVLNCYYMMYNGCSSLTDTGTLGMRILADGSCDRMFQSCSSLNYVKCLATDITAANCIRYWLNGVSSTGTFIKDENTTWSTGTSGIPTAWVVIDKRTMPTGYKQVEYAANPNKPNNYPAPNINTGIVLDPTQDTFEIALNVSFDEDGYIAHYQYGGMPFANNSGTSNQYPGTFYLLYRKNATTNTIYYMYVTELSKGGSISKSGIIDAPQTIRIEHTPTTINMLLNGTSVASKSGLSYDTSTMTTLTGYLYSYNVVSYNWIDPIYYFKWWRSETMIADYVPCVRESDGEVGFYDFVSNEFKLPARTGFFTAGEEI